MIHIKPIPAFDDNYIWCISNDDSDLALIVDPGTAEPVLKHLNQQQLSLAGILITHRHLDHIGGIEQCLEHYPAPVYGPDSHAIKPVVTQPLAASDCIEFEQIDLSLRVMLIPGHTSEHIAFYNSAFALVGDTVFVAGCGRIFDGTATELYDSIEKITKLPEQTKLYCAHEYTLANLKFAAIIEPDNPDIAELIRASEAKRQLNQPTVPTTVALEKRCNPFFRCHEQTVQHAVQQQFGTNASEPAEIFRLLRQWKDCF